MVNWALCLPQLGVEANTKVLASLPCMKVVPAAFSLSLLSHHLLSHILKRPDSSSVRSVSIYRFIDSEEEQSRRN